MKLPSEPFEKKYGNGTFLHQGPLPHESRRWGRGCLKHFSHQGTGPTGWGGRLKGSSDYLPIDHAGPSFVLAVFSREPGGAGALVPALLEIHAGSIVGTGG